MARPWPKLREIPTAWVQPQPARAIIPRQGTRIYSGARATVLTGGFGSYANNSADAELLISLTQLRARSRQLMRDAPYAKRARTIVVNNVVGAGVGMQGQVKNTRGDLHSRINDDIESTWCEWSCAANCHTGGALHFSDFERACMAEVFTAGEVIVRIHFRTFGQSDVPMALELVEAERIADELSAPVGGVPGSKMTLGIETDEFGRAIAYWIRDRHINELRPGQAGSHVTRVPAEQILHLRLIDRWPQTRGEPWLHTVLRKLNDMEEYSGSELTAARMSANYFATIHSDNEDPLPTEKQDDGSRQMVIEPGMIDQLPTGETLDFHAPNRPNSALDPFMRYMLREVAAGVGVSYESISRDYSQSNYSSSRLALLDDRDLWKVLQQWWARTFRDPLHRIWVQQAVLAHALTSIPIQQFASDMEAFTAVRWKFRGWSWVDPTKEVKAYKEAIGSGMTSTTAVIAATGGGVDIEDVIAERKEENLMWEAAGFKVNWTVTDVTVPAEAAAAAPAADDTNDGAEGQQPAAKVISMRAAQ